MRIVVGMSGGVDSAVAAALLLEAGHEVIGVTLRLWDGGEGLAAARRCCAPDDLRVAARTAAAFGIPHYVLDEREAFLECVVRPFADAYARAMTPNPCVVCNAEVKAPSLAAFAAGVGAGGFATGHYAAVEALASGRVSLRRGADRGKDQSYFLSRVRPAVLAALVTPLGGLRKAEVREIARRVAPAVAAKGDSQEACFLGRGGPGPVVERFASRAPPAGRIVLPDGKEVGRHSGIHRFTVGQRRRLGAGPGGARRYVIGIDAATGDVVVGDREEVGRDAFDAFDCRWLVDHAHAGGQSAASRLDAPRTPADPRGEAARDVCTGGLFGASRLTAPRTPADPRGEAARVFPPEGPLRCSVQFRSSAAPVEGSVVASRDGGRLKARLHRRAPICPGQAAVLYDGDRVLASGWIAGPEEEAT